MSSLSITILFCHGLYPPLQFALLPLLILPSLIHQLTSYKHFITRTNCIPVYTDGSKSQYGSGFTVLFPSQHFQFQLLIVFSVLTTELYTIHCFEKTSFLPIFILCIFKDSKNSFSLLYSLHTIHPLVYEIRLTILPLCP